MKKLARLTLFFSLCFVALFIVSILFGLLAYWIDMVRNIPAGAVEGVDATELAWKALPVALFLSILLALSYSVRRSMPVPLTLFCIIVLGCLFSGGGALGISRAGALRPALTPVSAVRGGPGLILTQSDNAMILLKESGDIRGSRVVSIPGRPLIYQEAPIGPNNTILKLPALPFRNDVPWFIQSLTIDFSLCSAELKSRLAENWLSFAAYAFSLVLLLGSLRFVLELSRWHLANLFIGALIFRSVLTLATFLGAGEINALIVSFLNGKAPPVFVTPLIFSALGVLIIFYTLLTRLARRGRNG